MRNKISIIAIIFILLGLIAGSNILYKRIKLENSQKDVGVVINFKDAVKLATYSSLDHWQLFKKLRTDSIIHTVAVSEDTINDLVEEGKLTLLKGSEIVNLYRIGHVNRFVLNHLFRRNSVPDPETFYLVIEEKDDYNRVLKYLNLVYGSENIKFQRKWGIVQVISDKDELLSTGIGVSKQKLTKLNKLGFSILIRFENSYRNNNELIQEKIKDISAFDNIKTFVFSGDSVLGYPNHISLMASLMSENNYNLGLIEFNNQSGFTKLSNLIQTNTYKVHGVNEYELERYSFEQMTARYVRAVKERNVKYLFYKPFFKTYTDKTILDDNFKTLSLLQEKLLKIITRLDLMEIYLSSLLLLVSMKFYFYQ